MFMQWLKYLSKLRGFVSPGRVNWGHLLEGIEVRMDGGRKDGDGRKERLGGVCKFKCLNHD